MSRRVTLRAVEQDDFAIFFDQQLDPEANWMAAFTSRDPTDRQAFMARCAEIYADTDILMQTVLVDGLVAGNVVSFLQNGEREVGYWFGRVFWGRGIATEALAAFLQRETRRPLLAYTARDNAASIRLLLKRGFVFRREGRTFSYARGIDVDELVLELRQP